MQWEPYGQESPKTSKVQEGPLDAEGATDAEETALEADAALDGLTVLVVHPASTRAIATAIQIPGSRRGERCIGTPLHDGWRRRIPKEWLVAISEAGEILVSADAAEKAGLDSSLPRQTLELKGREEPIEVVSLRVAE